MTVKVLCLSYQKARDATSAISPPPPPAMNNVRKVEVCACRSCSASAHRSCPAVMDRFYVSMLSHAMVRVLS